MKKTSIMKLLALMLCAMLVLSFVACNDEVETDGTDAKETNASEQTTLEETTEEETTVEETTAEETTVEQTTEEQTTDEVTTDEETTETEPPKPACEHEFDTNGEGLFCCVKCGYEPECGGVHDFVNDDPEGHYTVECEFCGAEEGRMNSHTYSEDAEYKCTECGYDPACGGKHTYTSDDKGHSVNECEECGAEAIDAVPHVYADAVVEGVHAAKCICGYTKTTTIPGAVEAYYTGNVISNTVVAQNSGNMDVEFVNEDGGYTRFDNLIIDGKDNGVWARLNVIHSETGIANARYVVFKYRINAENLNNTNTTYMTLYAASEYTVSTKAWNLPGTDNLNVDVKNDGQWHTIVVDLCRLDIEGIANNTNKDTGYDAETQSMNLKLLQFQPLLRQFMTNPDDAAKMTSAWTAESSFDLAYVAVVDNYADLKEIIDQETYTFRIPTQGTTNYTFRTKDIGDTAPSEAPLACFGEHVYADAIVDGKHVAKCICGDTKTTTVPETVEAYYTGDVIANTKLAVFESNMDVEFVAAAGDEVAYTRFDNLTFTANAVAAQAPWTRLNVIHSETGIANARYVVFKYRINAENLNNTNTTYMTLFASSEYTESTKAWNLPGTDNLNVDVKNDGQWHTIVVDLCRLDIEGIANNTNKDTGYDAETQSMNLKLLQFQPLLKQFMNNPDNTTQAQSAWTAESSFDLAYVAVVDEYADLKDIIDQETYTFRIPTQGTTNYTFNTADIGETAPTAAP